MANQNYIDAYKKLFDSENNSAKAQAFDLIADQFYNVNFGRLSKADFEVLLFHIYIEQCLRKGHPYDDYTLSKELGITQTRVRALKVKKELQYPYADFNWKESFVGYISKARYDEKKALVKLQIPDVNVLMELRNYIETHGWYDEYQLNPKLFQCRVDIFIELCNSLDEGNGEITLNEEQKKRLAELKRSSRAGNEQSALDMIIAGDIKDGLKKLALEGAKELLCQVLGSLPGGKLFAKALNGLHNALMNS